MYTFRRMDTAKLGGIARSFFLRGQEEGAGGRHVESRGRYSLGRSR